MRLIQFPTDGEFPAELLQRAVEESLRTRRGRRVAIIANYEELESLPKFDFGWLEPDEDYQWSGWLVQRKVRRPAKRIFVGSYEEWFEWYMRSQRFRAFHSIVLVEPVAAVSEKEHGGYLDGWLARLVGKVKEVIVVYSPGRTAMPISDESRTMQVLRALLYGTRESKPSLMNLAHATFVPIKEESVLNALQGLKLHLTNERTRYQLDGVNGELLEKMVMRIRSRSEAMSRRAARPFARKKPFGAQATLPDKMLAARAIEDARRWTWVTVPFEAGKLSGWLKELNEQGDFRLKAIYEQDEYVSNDQWEALLAPSRNQVRRVLDELVYQGKLEKKHWIKEVGRPAEAYVAPGVSPFSEQSCGQCAFYASVRRRCRLWWLVNKKQPFFHPAWRQPGSRVGEFEIHKMKRASKIGLRSSACLRFVDKKRDHVKAKLPGRCEVCGTKVPPFHDRSSVCHNCGTTYVKLTSGVRVLTAYNHRFERAYKEIIGGDPKADLETWKAKERERLRDRDQMMAPPEDFEDLLAEEAPDPTPEPPRIELEFDADLEDKVESLMRTTDVKRQLSIAMARSALTATRRILELGNVYSGDADPLLARQAQYFARMSDVSPEKLLPYEALIMKQYWLGFGFALRGVQEWFGPRKRSRFVADHVHAYGGRARGYSPIDAAINYLHQRRRAQADRSNAEVGFPGTCDGILHRKNYNSRKVGLVFDMIDPFKFADREELLLVLLNRGLTWRDFEIETDRRGSTFYYPNTHGEAKLKQAGQDADDLVVNYQGIDSSLVEAYRRFAASLLATLDTRGTTKQFTPFEFAPVK